jgi:hypothetical protein
MIKINKPSQMPVEIGLDREKITHRESSQLQAEKRESKTESVASNRLWEENLGDRTILGPVFFRQCPQRATAAVGGYHSPLYQSTGEGNDGKRTIISRQDGIKQVE